MPRRAGVAPSKQVDAKQGMRATVAKRCIFPAPFRPAWGRKGYNKQCCKMRAECAGLRGTTQMHGECADLRGGGEQHALSASPRNGDAKGHCTSMRRSTQENRFHTISAQQLPAFARADTAPAKAARTNAYRMQRSCKGDHMQPIPHQRRTAQRPPPKGSRTVKI